MTRENEDDSSVQDPLLDDPEEQREPASRVAAITVPQLFKARELRKPLLIVIFSMLSQQTSGRHIQYFPSNGFVLISFVKASMLVHCFCMFFAVNANPVPSKVLYYSNDILSKALPDFGPYVSLGITVVNVLMTFPPIFLIEVGCLHIDSQH